MMGRHRRPARRKLTWAAAYLLLMSAGTAALAWPNPAVARAAESERLLIYVWVGMLIVGAASAMVGALTGRWVGEYLGIPLLSAVFMVYSIGALSSGRLETIAGGLSLASFGLAFLARGVEVNAIRREAVAEAKRRTVGDP